MASPLAPSPAAPAAARHPLRRGFRRASRRCRPTAGRRRAAGAAAADPGRPRRAPASAAVAGRANCAWRQRRADQLRTRLLAAIADGLAAGAQDDAAAARRGRRGRRAHRSSPCWPARCRTSAASTATAEVRALVERLLPLLAARAAHHRARPSRLLAPSLRRRFRRARRELAGASPSSCGPRTCSPATSGSTWENGSLQPRHGRDLHRHAGRASPSSACCSRDARPRPHRRMAHAE